MSTNLKNMCCKNCKKVIGIINWQEFLEDKENFFEEIYCESCAKQINK